jgi:glycerol-3-phosphate dehydrogenase (NAD(P)+)
VLNARSALELARRVHVELPIVCAVHRVLFERHPARAAIADLMTRELRAEHDR